MSRAFLGFLSVAVLLTCTNASVERFFSAVYDRIDIEGQAQIPLPICSDGCFLYASISSSNTADAIDHLSLAVLQDLGVITTFFKFSTLIPTLDNGLKKYSRLGTGADYIIFNSAPHKPVVPIVIYAVSLKFFDRVNPPYSVYEARLFNKTSPHQFDRITIMSADVFTLQSVQADNLVNLYAGGYDVESAPGTPDKCFPLYTGSDSKNLAPVPFPSPLMTLWFPAYVNYTFTLKMGANDTIILENGQHTALMSPGYGGCGNQQPFRYTAKPEQEVYVVQSAYVNQLSNFSLNNDVITNGSIRLLTSGGSQSIYGNITNRFSQTSVTGRWISPVLMQADEKSSLGIRVTLVNSWPIQPTNNSTSQSPNNETTATSSSPSNTTATSTKQPETTTKSAGHYFGFLNTLLMSVHLLHHSVAT